MSRTVTAFFDSRDEAEAARSRLSDANIDANRVRIVDQSSSSSSGSSGEGQGIWESIKSAFMPEEDSHAYEEGMRRGGYLLCAEVDEDQEDRAMQLLDQDGSVDFDQRRQEWQAGGWQPSSQDHGQQPRGEAQQFGTQASARTVEEERIPIVEEELRVGKREVVRGGARVRSYLRETPVHEQVQLREEHVSVERRPVDQPLGRGEIDRDPAMLQDRTVEMTEHNEEAVVGKEARVREELVLKKTASERTEQIDDSVRRTEVDVEEGQGQGSGDRPAFSSFGGERIPSENERARSESYGSESYGNGDADRETTGSGRDGYSPRIDKSGL